MKMETKSPLKAKPLRNPGQSLDEEIDRVVSEKDFVYLVATGLAVFNPMMERLRWFRPHPPKPAFYSIIAFLVCAFCVYRFFRVKKYLNNLQLGRDGERAVGQYLERFRNNGAQIFHDIISDDFNIDHVIVSEQGVYVIETKTYSKPRRGRAVIDYDGKSLIMGNGFKGSDIIIQAKAEASWLGDMIRESTGKKVYVRPVVLFLGWYIQWALAAKDAEVWVLNPKSIVGVCR